jgi:hypothetical protein
MKGLVYVIDIRRQRTGQTRNSSIPQAKVFSVSFSWPV